jgi:hypothetical protein
MDMQSIMVQVTERQWTLAAMHLACALARQAGLEVALVKMVPVQHVGWLGTELGNLSLTPQDRKDMRDYQMITEDYGVQSSNHYFQYVTLSDAIVDAAAYVEAQVVFATLPASVIPYWRRFQLWWLHQSLARQHRSFYTLEQPVDAAIWTPSVLVRPTAEQSRPDKGEMQHGLQVKSR